MFFISFFLQIIIHEGGHFLLAKLCKVKVNEFAIGFGPTIFAKEKGETKYALRLIPLGGFVSMEGEEERSLKEGSFSMASIPKRIAIVASGGIVNIIDEMAFDAIKDDYFLSLFHTAEKMYWHHILEPHKLSTYVFSSKESISVEMIFPFFNTYTVLVSAFS